MISSRERNREHIQICSGSATLLAAAYVPGDQQHAADSVHKQRASRAMILPSWENGTESTSELVESEQHILSFLDSMDSYLILMDTLSSSLRQGWLELASARHSMGSFRVNSALFDLKSHHASTTVQVRNGDPDTELPCFTLYKWASCDDPDKYSEEAKFEEDELLREKSNNSPRVQHHEVLERRVSDGSPVTPDNQAQKERFKSLSMFGTLVSPKLRATQLSFETALEMLIEIANVRASLLRGYDQVQSDLNLKTA